MSPAEQDARVRYHAPPDAPATLRAALIQAVRVRFGWPALGVCQDESVQVLRWSGGFGEWEYSFDHDFASQYDRAERWAGTVRLGEGTLQVEWAAP